MESKSSTAAGIGLSGLCLLWGLVTQCLNWAGILQWPWYAYWGPLLIVVMAWAVTIIVVIVGILIIGVRSKK